MRGKRDKSKKFPTNWEQEKKERKDLASSQQPQARPAPLHPSESVMLFCLLESNRARNWMSSQTQSPDSVERGTGLTFKYGEEEERHTTLYWL